MSQNFNFPTTKDGWIKLGYHLGDNIKVHAVNIKMIKKRVTSPHGNHRVDEALAKGSVEVTSSVLQSTINIKKFN